MAAKRKGKGKGGTGASLSKLSNKRLNKLGKQGKLKKQKDKKKLLLKKLSGKSGKGRTSDLIGTSLPSIEDPLEDEDFEFYGQNSANLSFTHSINNSLIEKLEGKRKRKKAERDDEVEEEFEQTPRKFLSLDRPTTDVKLLLPIKTKDRLIPQMMELERNREHVKEAEADRAEEEGVYLQAAPQPIPALSSTELFNRRREKLLQRKQMIAMLASSVMQHPEGNLKKLKDLRLMLEEDDPDVMITVRKLVMVSLMELFKDIIPGYRIRPLSESERNHKLKQETKTLQDYETGLLNNYRLYLEVLEKTIKGTSSSLKRGQKQNKSVRETVHIPQPSAKVLSELSVKCLCEMLVSHAHFNYRNNIIAVLVPLMANPSTQLSDPVCDVVRKIFKSDKSGDISLEIVKLVGRIIKAKNYKVQPKVLDTFLCLKIKEVYMGSEDEKKNGMKRKEKMLKFSRRERKRQKQMDNLEKELLETKAAEDKKAKLKQHTEIIQSVFLTYFRIIKTAKKSVLLSSVLEGLARFSHLINIEFFDDLFTVLNELIESGTLNYRETLHCVLTAFTILSGQGAALTVDPMRFYRQLYKVLFRVHAGSSSEDISIILDCLDVMINKRKRQVSEHRVLAYLKRLCSLCLQLLPNGCVSTLASCRNIIQSYSRSDLLFDNETQGSGLYLPELEDPEHCHAHNTALWELPLLMRHYHPMVRRYTYHVSRQAPTTGDGQLPADMVRRTPRELLVVYELGPMKFSSSVPENVKANKKMTRLKGWRQGDFRSQTEQVLSSTPDIYGL